MRYLFLIVSLLIFPVSARALQVEKYQMGTDVLIFRHFVGGKSETWVKNNTKAKQVSVAGFFGEKTINGRKQLYGVDLWMLDGKICICSQYNRPVLVSYWDGTVAIVPNFKAIRDPAGVMSAAAGMRIPPKQTDNLPRQFWAVKGKYFYRFEMKGTAKQCQKVAKEWGFKSIIHFDGGLTLVTRFSPSHATVYHKPKAKDLPVSAAKLRLGRS